MKTITLFVALTGMSFMALAEPESFDFKDPKGVNNVIFKTDAPLESINGTASDVSGNVDFDAAKPESLKGKIVVKAASLHVPNATMQGHLQGAQWLDVAKYPDITFEALSVSNVKTANGSTTADVTGTMTLHGISKEVTAKDVKITFLKDKLADRFPSLKGDLLVIRASFIIKRSDFGINKGQYEDKVSDDIRLELNIAGQAPH